MNPRNTAIKDLNSSGYLFKRSGGNYDIYYNPNTKYSIPQNEGILMKTIFVTYVRKSGKAGKYESFPPARRYL